MTAPLQTGEFPALFSPINIAGMQLNNRIVMSPMTTNYGSPEQTPTERLFAYLEARAAGGVGLITLEVCSVALEHRYQPNSLSLSEDRFIELHKPITGMIHSYGAKVQPQLTHPGPESMASFFEGIPGVGPSVNVNPAAHQASRPLELEEIPGIIDQYVAGALRAKAAGYDGIELHAAHCYMLLGSFLSPLRNSRKDEYGGKRLAGRARLLLETLTAIKSAVGPDFPVTVSLSGFERFPGGSEINESQQLAQLLVEAGADAFRISGGTTDGLVSQMVMGSDYGDAPNLTAATAIRQAVNVPVIVVGRIHTPQLAEQILNDGGADLVAMARPFLADPEWPDKARRGDAARIRRCISCENCVDSMIEHFNLNCAVNALAGREHELSITAAEKKKNVLVVGAGASGMEAARVCAARGHKVSLIDRQGRLGGSLLLASTVHSDNEPMLDWLKNEVRRSAINVQLNQPATAEFLQQLKPDAVIVATGAKLETAAIPGSDLPHVFSGEQMRRIVEGRATSDDFRVIPSLLHKPALAISGAASSLLTPKLLRAASARYLPLGKRIVIVGADLAAIELAEFLANRGRRISMIEPRVRISREIGPKRLAEHMARLDKLRVTINTDAMCQRIHADHIEYTSANGEQHTLAADAVIIAGEPVADSAVFDELSQHCDDIYAIGDSTGLGLIRKAMEDAMRAACSI